MTSTLAQNLWAAAELLVGFVIVMLTLAMLWGLTVLMSRLVAWLERPTATAALAPTPASVAAVAPGEEEIAVLAAAVAVVLDRPHRIVHVLPLNSAWGLQGRLDTHASHRKY